MAARELEHILDDCIARMLDGEGVEQCLQRYPERAAELEPLLRVASVAQEVSLVKPRPEFRAQVGCQIRSALRASKPETKPRRVTLFGGLPRWATAMSAVMVLLMAGGGTVAASNGSMPDNFLYPIKLATERAWLALTLSDEGKAELHARFAERRVSEIVYLAREGVPEEEVGEVASRLASHLGKIEQLAIAKQEGPNGEKVEELGEMRQTLEWYNIENQGMFHEAKDEIPPGSEGAVVLANAYTSYGEWYEQAFTAAGGSPEPNSADTAWQLYSSP